MNKILFKVFTFMMATLVVTLSASAKYSNVGQDKLSTTGNENIITISSSEDFSDFYGKLCGGATFAGQTVVLNNDVSFNTGGKTGTKTFEGTFDGQGHKLKDVNSSIFTTNKGNIQNLHVSSGTLNGSGIFCSTNYGTIVNCKNSANVRYSSSSSEGIRAAAICTSNYGDIINCTNEGKVELELIAIYGSWSKATSNCGGICAYSGKGSSIVNCTNTGNINNSGIYFSVTGGIVASSEHASIVGCKNYGLVYSYILNSSPSKGNVTVESYQHQHVGGIAGHVLYCLINRCTNYGTVKSNFQYLGGIAGYVGNSDVYNLINFGDLEGYEGYGFHSVSGIIPYFKNPYKRQYFFNCINHGNITVFAKYGIATGAGISAEIENAYIANCFSNASISCSHTGNMSSEFQISQYECENSEELNSGINNPSDANAFISSYDSPETLLRWTDNEGTISLLGDYFSHPIAQHGSCNVFVYPEEPQKYYTLKIWTNVSRSEPIASLSSKSPLEARGLIPDTDYYFEVFSEDGTTFLDNGNFRTLSPTIQFNATSIDYDNITFNQSCGVQGVDTFEATLLFGSNEQDLRNISVTDSIISVNGLDEESEYSAQILYKINGKEYKSDKIISSTKSIIPQFSLLSSSPYSLTLKCDNFEELKRFSPSIFIENPKYFDIGGFIIGESRSYELDNDGIVSIDSLLYGYSPKIFGKYTINGEDRHRNCESTFSTTNWGGEGIIQFSPKAAMIHGLFGGMGGIAGGYNDRYDRARFYYRDATASDDVSESYIDGACIDNGVDYAVTIPINSLLYQYYISLQYSRYTNPKNKAKDGDWQVIDARNPTVDIVEPRFFNARFEGQTIKCSCIEGEEKITRKYLQYKVEDTDNFNDITFSTKQGTEALSKTLKSIVPQLNYIIRFGCTTDNGKKYFSPYYRLNNNVLELASDYDDNILVSSISIEQESIKLSVGETLRILAHVLPENASEKHLTWISSDVNVATVDNEGNVKAISPGYATITVKSTDGSNVYSTFNVNVIRPVVSITLSESDFTMKVGEYRVLDASVNPTEATDQSLMWTSSDNSIVSVQNGIVLAHQVGDVVIRVEAADGSGSFAECKIEVNDVSIELVSVDFEIDGYASVTYRMVKNEPTGIYIRNTKDWKLVSLTLDDNDVTEYVTEEGYYEVPALESNAKLSAKFEYAYDIELTEGSGIGNIYSENREIKVYNDADNIVVEGLIEGDNVSVYTVGGMMIANHVATTMDTLYIAAPAQSIYIIRVNNGAVKLQH